jgi:hypothetical protein
VCVCASGFNPGQKEKGEGGGYLECLCVSSLSMFRFPVFVCVFLSLQLQRVASLLLLFLASS